MVRRLALVLALVAGIAGAAAISPANAAPAGPRLVRGSTSMTMTGAVNPLYTGAFDGNLCFFYHGQDAVCGSLTVTFTTTGYQGLSAPLAWTVSAMTRR